MAASAHAGLQFRPWRMIKNQTTTCYQRNDDGNTQQHHDTTTAIQTGFMSLGIVEITLLTQLHDVCEPSRSRILTMSVGFGKLPRPATGVRLR